MNKICNECGQELPNTATVCDLCGATLPTALNMTHQTASYIPPQQLSQSNTQVKNPDSKKLFLKLSRNISIAVCVIIVGLVALYINRFGYPEWGKTQEKTKYPMISHTIDEIIDTPIDGIYAIKGEILILTSKSGKLSYINRLAKQYNGELVGYIDNMGFYHAKFPVETYADLISLAQTVNNDPVIEKAAPEMLIPCAQSGFVATGDNTGEWWQKAIEMFPAQYEAAKYDLSTVKIGVIDNYLDWTYGCNAESV